MRRLSLTIMMVVFICKAMPQSPHGTDFKIDCASCHSSSDWRILKEGRAFDHNQTGFKLDGQHQETSCRNCHPTLEFKTDKKRCWECHSDVHNNTLGFNCDRCHTTRTWIIENAALLHNESRFPLMGTHKTTDCFECHKSATNLQFEPLSVECVDCHLKDYNATTSPNHQQGGFSTSCTDCHSAKAVSWTQADIDHSFFPLSGGHSISCIQCHTSGSFGSLPNQCVDCHQADYNSTQNPSHTEAQFSFECQSCHTIQAWQPSTFNHNNTSYPLTGAHLTTSCYQCHNGDYTSTPNTCNACHSDDYNNTSNPNHTTAQFPTDCQTCHNTKAWQPSTFNHDGLYFPIYSGKHRNQWTNCADCHKVASNYSSFSCIDCHEHNQAETNSHHNEVNGYSYTSAACYSCHPRGTH